MSSAISVIVPAYNSAQYMARCLQALRESRTAPFETIVVDDGSIDNTAEIAASFGA
jgi:glycosyltransferase involved in cell wall biosynthesis